MSFSEDAGNLHVKLNDESMFFVEGSEADDDGKTSFQEVSCFNSDDSDLNPNFVPAVSDGSEDTDPEDVVEAQITSLKKYSRKVSSKRRNQAKTYVNVKGNVVSERKLRPLSNYRMKCRGKIPQTLQETI